MALATISWLLLALPVIVPGTLSVQVQLDGFTKSLPCIVPIFDRGGQSSAEVPYRNPNYTAHDFLLSGLPNPQTWKLVEDTILGNGVTFLSTPCGPNCTYQTAFHGPGLDCESHPNYKMSARCQDCPFLDASFEVRINTSASPADLPRDWIWPESPEFLEQKTFPIYASFIDDSNVSTLWIQYLQNDSVSPISNSAMMSFEPTQADQAWQTLACTLQNTTYSVNVSFQDWVPAVNAKMVSSTPISTIGHSEFSYDVQNAQYLDPTTAFFESISGSIYADTVNYSMTGALVRVLGVSYSNLANMTTTPANFTGNLIWSVTSNFTTAIPELLTNITLNIMATNRPTYNTTCNSTRTEIV